MASVEQAISRLDGVDYVSAGWRTEKAAIRAKPGTALDAATLNKALEGTSFKVEALEPAR